MADKMLVTLDGARFDRKPHGVEIAAITKRLQAAGPCEVTPEQFAQAIADGRTWCGGCYEPCASGWGRFLGLRIFALDFDNKRDGRDLREGDSGFLGAWQALERWRSMFGDPLCMYPTFSFKQVPDLSEPPTRHRFRLAFDLGETLTDKSEAQAAVAMVLARFHECDANCRNLNRLFFGASDKVVAFTGGGVYYANRS